MKGLWDYKKAEAPFPYGGDDLTYKKAMDFLSDCEVVEDWGCGTAYAKRFCTIPKYVGIDGSESKFADKVADLREYVSEADGILMRHILEHNHDWRKVLENALKSFKKKFVLVIFTPFQEKTKVLALNAGYGNVPDIGFRKQDLEDLLQGFAYSEQALRTKTQYGVEHIFFVQR
jgi:SAM-dependent methyltransferase